MAFDAADSYDAFMGRWSAPLAVAALERLDLRPGQRALDVGCGPGAVTRLLAERLGAEHVVGVDASAPFVAAARERLPGVDIREGTAAALPLDDDVVDLALAQLVIHFLPDAVAGLRDMARVTRPGGVVAASVWDFRGSRAPQSPFWEAVRALDPGAVDETHLTGTGAGELVALFTCAGLVEIEEQVLTVSRQFGTFEEWWAPYTLGVGPPGDHVAGLDDAGVRALQQACVDRLGPGPFRQDASAFWVTGRAR